MANRTLQLRRGTQSENNAFAGALGEVTVDTTRKTLVVHDGSTPGGSALATLASPSLSGNPTAPTQSPGNDSTRLATTAFVQAAIAGFTPGATNSDDITEGTSHLYFTVPRARAAISVGGSLSYVGGVISYSTPTNISSFTNDVGYLTSASIKTEISATGDINYDAGTGVISYTESVNSVNGLTGPVVLTSDNIAEGTSNKYASSSTVRGYLSSGTGLSYSGGAFSLTNTSVTVNTKTLSLLTGGSVTLSTDDVSEGSTNKYATSTTVRGYFSSGTGVSITSGQISIGQSISSTDTPTFAGLTVNGDVNIDSATFKIDSTNNRVGIVNSNPAYTLDVTGDVNLTGNLRLSGSAGTSGYILQSQGESSSPTWANISTVLPSITELDEFKIDGGTTVFSPTNNGTSVTITAPIQALIVKNGVTLKPYINNSKPMWFSGISYGDYTLDSVGRIVFTSVPQRGDSINVRILVGNTANTINKTYPYRPIDIMTGY